MSHQNAGNDECLQYVLCAYWVNEIMRILILINTVVSQDCYETSREL